MESGSEVGEQDRCELGGKGRGEIKVRGREVVWEGKGGGKRGKGKRRSRGHNRSGDRVN